MGLQKIFALFLRPRPIKGRTAFVRSDSNMVSLTLGGGVGGQNSDEVLCRGGGGRPRQPPSSSSGSCCSSIKETCYFPRVFSCLLAYFERGEPFVAFLAYFLSCLLLILDFMWAKSGGGASGLYPKRCLV